jgi:hypothetical protein
VDCSSIIEQARKIVQKNGFEDKITLIRGKIEEIELPVQKVDIIGTCCGFLLACLWQVRYFGPRSPTVDASFAASRCGTRNKFSEVCSHCFDCRPQRVA